MSLSSSSSSSSVRRNQRMLSATKDQAHFHSNNTSNSRLGGSPAGFGSGVSSNGGHTSIGSGGVNSNGVQVRSIPTMRSTVSMVEKELVQNNIHKAELIATSAINSFLEDPTQFRHLAATASGPKVVQALTPFWSLVTLLVQCKLLGFHQGIEEGGFEATSEYGQGSPSQVNSPSGLFGSHSNSSSSFTSHGGSHHHHQRSHSNSNSPAAVAVSGGGGGAMTPPIMTSTDAMLPSDTFAFQGMPPQYVATLMELEAFLPRLFERLEAIRDFSVPPQARILQTQVLRSLKRHHEALRYMEDSVLGNALETTAFVSDSDEGGESGVSESGGGGRAASSSTTAAAAASAGIGGRAQTPMPTTVPLGPTPRDPPLGRSSGKGSRKGKTSNNNNTAGTPRYNAHGSSFSNEGDTTTAVRTITRGDNNTDGSGGGGDSSTRSAMRSKKRAKTEKRTTRILSWTPKTTLAAIEVYISICFESSSIAFNLGDDSGQVEPVAAEQVTVALDSAEKRCIEFLSMYADALNQRLRSCFPATMDSPSVFDEVLSRVEARHEKTLQVWNHQQMSFITNPVQVQLGSAGPDTPPHRPYDELHDGHHHEDGKHHSQSRHAGFPSLPLSFGGGTERNDDGGGAVAEGGSSEFDAPATQRKSGRGARGTIQKIGQTLQQLLVRLWHLVTKRNLGLAVVGLSTLFTLFMLAVRLTQSRRPVAGHALPPVRQAAPSRAAVTRRMQAF